MEPIQMKISEKEKTFSEFFLAYLSAILNLKNLPTKDDPDSRSVSGNTASEKYGYINI